jgi:hypothetical protein
MPFSQAGINLRNRNTGIRGFISHVRGNRGGFKPAELRIFACGDRFWCGQDFIAWGECVYFATILAGYREYRRGWQYPQSELP